MVGDVFVGFVYFHIDCMFVCAHMCNNNIHKHASVYYI